MESDFELAQLSKFSMDSGDKRKAATIEVPVEGGEYKEFDDTEMNKPAPHDDFDGNELVSAACRAGMRT